MSPQVTYEARESFFEQWQFLRKDILELLQSWLTICSLPSLLTPVKDKRHLNMLMGVDFITIYGVYILLCTSALFAFGENPNPHCSPYPSAACVIQSLYTLNFSSYSIQQHWFTPCFLYYTDIRPIAIFLTLFPVFTLSTNFPLISITLRNNLMVLIPIGGNQNRLWELIELQRIILVCAKLGLAFLRPFLQSVLHLQHERLICWSISLARLLD